MTSIYEPETLRDKYKNRLEPASTQAMSIDSHLSVTDLKLKAPGNLTPEQANGMLPIILRTGF